MSEYATRKQRAGLGSCAVRLQVLHPHHLTASIPLLFVMINLIKALGFAFAGGKANDRLASQGLRKRRSVRTFSISAYTTQDNL